jgi:restriction endonuclease Mrr
VELPTWEGFLVPILQVASDGRVRTRREMYAAVADHMQLTEQARRIGGTGDGGVDGVIDQDKLGLQRIYVQAKRYAADNTVSREAIQAFVGALHGRNVSQGIFITTSRFSPGAVEYASNIGTRLSLSTALDLPN